MAERAGTRLAAALAARTIARAALMQRLNRLRPLASPQGIKQRLIAEAKIRAQRAAGQAVELAAENRGPLAGVAAAAALGAFRRPLWRTARAGIARAGAMRANSQGEPAIDSDDIPA